MRDFRAVAEGFGDQRWGTLEDEFTEGAVPCCKQVDAQGPEAHHHGLWIEVTACSGAWEQPWVGARPRAQVGPAPKVLPDQPGKGFGGLDGV